MSDPEQRPRIAEGLKGVVPDAKGTKAKGKRSEQSPCRDDMIEEGKAQQDKGAEAARRLRVKEG